MLLNDSQFSFLVELLDRLDFVHKQADMGCFLRPLIDHLLQVDQDNWFGGPLVFRIGLLKLFLVSKLTATTRLVIIFLALKNALIEIFLQINLPEHQILNLLLKFGQKLPFELLRYKCQCEALLLVYHLLTTLRSLMAIPSQVLQLAPIRTNWFSDYVRPVFKTLNFVKPVHLSLCKVIYRSFGRVYAQRSKCNAELENKAYDEKVHQIDWWKTFWKQYLWSFVQPKHFVYLTAFCIFVLEIDANEQRVQEIHCQEHKVM